MESIPGTYQQRLKQHLQKFIPEPMLNSPTININSLNISLNSNHPNYAKFHGQKPALFVPVPKPSKTPLFNYPVYAKQKNGINETFTGYNRKVDFSHSYEFNQGKANHSEPHSQYQRNSSAILQRNAMKSTQCYSSKNSDFGVEVPSKLPIDALQNQKVASADELQRQNLQLKQQNQSLKAEISELKKSTVSSTTINAGSFKNQRSNSFLKGSESNVTLSPQEDFDSIEGRGRNESLSLKGSQQLNHMSVKLGIALKQCSIYETIIQKMETKIHKLTIQNRDFHVQLLKQKALGNTIILLQQQVDFIFAEYQKLEHIIESSEEEWFRIRKEWMSERNYYHSKLSQLEEQKIILKQLHEKTFKFTNPPRQQMEKFNKKITVTDSIEFSEPNSELITPDLSSSDGNLPKLV